MDFRKDDNQNRDYPAGGMPPAAGSMEKKTFALGDIQALKARLDELEQMDIEPVDFAPEQQDVAQQAAETSAEEHWEDLISLDLTADALADVILEAAPEPLAPDAPAESEGSIHFHVGQDGDATPQSQPPAPEPIVSPPEPVLPPVPQPVTPSVPQGGAHARPRHAASAGGPGMPKKKHGVLLVVAAHILALCLGAGLMFVLIQTNVVDDVIAYVEELFAYWATPSLQGGRPNQNPNIPEIPGAPNLPASPGEEVPLDPDQQLDLENIPKTNTVTPFVPIPGAPSLALIEAEFSRTVLTTEEIADLAKPSVVGVIKNITEYEADGYTIGSGIIFTEDGYIITNEHVISAPYHSIKIVLNDGTEYEAELICADANADIAILKIDAWGLRPAEFGDSRQLQVGTLAVAIGCPASVDLQGTTTAGIISALDRVITVDSNGKTMRLLQTDAAINPGNSGGPLLNKYGQVIGINTIKMTSSTYEGLCFAIPTSELESIVADLFAYGYVRGYPAIGISAGSVAEEEQEDGVVTPAGVLVAFVNSGSGAHGIIEVGDIITHCNGKEIVAVSQINTIKNRLRVGESITLTVYRAGETFDVEIVLVDQYDLAE